jgi:hypothetical protein
MQNFHAGSVQHDDQEQVEPANTNGSAPARNRAAQRPRTSRPLPTDRLKFAIQPAALKAIAVASNYGERAVGGEDIAAKLGVSANTAALNNAFFADVGLIVRESKGLYKPVEAASEFARRATFNETEAATHLRTLFSDYWAFQDVKQQLLLGPATQKQMIQVLAHTAGASKDHETQLLNILLWLEFVGLIVIADGHIQLGQHDLQDLQDPNLKPPVPPVDPPLVAPGGEHGAAGKGEGSTKDRRQEAPGNPILTVNFDLALSAEDLSALSGEQITALFEGAGKIAAVKAAMAEK